MLYRNQEEQQNAIISVKGPEKVGNFNNSSFEPKKMVILRNQTSHQETYMKNKTKTKEINHIHKRDIENWPTNL